jgi:hypothetical protein
MSHVDDGTLHAYLDGQLSPVEREQLERHLAACPACRARLDEERALIERADALLALAAPPERAIPPFHELRHARPWMRLRLPLAWAATVLLAVGFGWYLRTWRAERRADAVNGVVALRDSPQSQNAVAEPAREERSTIALRGRAADRAQQQPTVPPPSTIVDSLAKASTEGAGAAPAPIEVAPSVVNAQPRAELRAAPPPPAAPAASESPKDAGAVAPAARGGGGGRVPVVLTTSWPIIGLDAARPTLGVAPVTIPGLPVRNVRRSPLGDGVVLVEQALDSTRVIQLFQRRADQPALAGGVVRTGVGGREGRADSTFRRMYAGDREAKVMERLARYVGTLRVEIAGPLSTDSLSKLLELVR